MVTKVSESPHAMTSLISELPGLMSRQGSKLLAGSLGANAVVALATPVQSAEAGNTGSSTMTGLAASTSTKHGRYVVTMLTPTTFSVEHSPTGMALANGTVDVAYDDWIGFTLPAGTPAYVAGDIIYVDVGVAEYDPGGSAPLNAVYAVMMYKADSTTADERDAETTIVYRDASFNVNDLVWKTGVTDVEKRAAYDEMAALGMRVLH